MAKTNTKRMTSHAWRKTLHTWTLGGAAAALVLNIMSLIENVDIYTGFGMFIIGAVVFFVIFLIGLIAAWVSSGNMEKRIKTLEQNAPMTFDADQLEPVNQEKNLLLGKEWLVINAGGTAVPFTKAEIASADPISIRKEGMQKLWARITDQKGKRWACMYKAQEPDPLQRVLDWIGETKQQEPAEVTRAAEPVPPGTCPHCTGPNDPKASICQWCGSSLDAPVQNTSFSEPEKTVSPAPQTVVRASIPEEPSKNGKGVYIVIAVLAVVLAGLLGYLFLWS